MLVFPVKSLRSFFSDRKPCTFGKSPGVGICLATRAGSTKSRADRAGKCPAVARGGGGGGEKGSWAQLELTDALSLRLPYL